MKLVDIMIIVAAILGTTFPAFFINAIRSESKEQAEKDKVKACVIFGILVFISLCIVNS